MSPNDFIGRDDVISIGDRALADLAARPPTSDELFLISLMVTSGTSGGRPLVMAWDRLPGEMGLVEWQNIVISFGAMTTRLFLTLRALKEGKLCHVFTADSCDLTDEFSGLMADFAPQHFCGYTVFTQRLGEYMSAESANGVRFLYLSGGKLTPDLETTLQERFSNATIRQFYGANEVGIIGAQPCPSLGINCYHPIPRVAVDIVEPDQDGIGNIVITKTYVRTKVQQYRNGDLGRWSEKPCECGRPFFEVLGREGLDRVKIAGALLLREEFDRVVKQCGDLFEDYRTEVFEQVVDGHVKGHIILTVFTKGSRDETLRADIKRRVSDGLRLTPTRTLSELVASGDFLPLTVEFTSEPFEQKNKEVKVRSVHE